MNVHADLIEQYAQDWKETDRPWERWEFLNPAFNIWQSQDGHPTWISEFQYRRKPRTFMVGDVEVRPVQEAPKAGQEYYWPSVAAEKFCFCGQWSGSEAQNEMLLLKRGLIHLNKEDAIAHGKALAALTGGE